MATLYVLLACTPLLQSTGQEKNLSFFMAIVVLHIATLHIVTSQTNFDAAHKKLDKNLTS